MLYLGIGRRERGKTTLMYYMLAKLDRRAIFDPRGLVQRAKTVRVRRGGEELANAFDALAAGEIEELAFSPADDNLNYAFTQFAGELKRWIVEYSDVPLGVLIDEISFVDRQLEHDAFQWALKCSPRDTFHVFLTCHRPNDIPVSIRSIADHWLVFHCRQEHDLKVLRERCDSSVAEAAENLQARQFIHWDDEHGKFKLYEESDSWFIELAPQRNRARNAPKLDELPATELRASGQRALFGG